MNILLPFFRVLIDADGKIVDMDGDYYDLTQEGSEAVLEELVSAATASEEKVGDLRDYNLRYYRSGARKWSYGKTPDRNPVPETAPTAEATSSSAGEDAPAYSDGGAEVHVPDRPAEAEPASTDGQIIIFMDISSEIATMQNLYRTCVIIGLGLSIAENIVKNHKGRIWAESAEGINTFRVELPMA